MSEPTYLPTHFADLIRSLYGFNLSPTVRDTNRERLYTVIRSVRAKVRGLVWVRVRCLRKGMRRLVVCTVRMVGSGCLGVEQVRYAYIDGRVRYDEDTALGGWMGVGTRGWECTVYPTRGFASLESESDFGFLVYLRMIGKRELKGG